MTADGTPTVDWRALGERLAVALGIHRSDMHQKSGRPCATCQFSKAVLEEWLEATGKVRPSTDGGEGT